MDNGLEELRSCIQDALDELSSPRASSEARTKALDRLEKQVATSCLATDKCQEHEGSWGSFLALQYTFECNVPSRLISWICSATPKLEQVAGTNTSEERTLTSQLARALSLIQGITLSHESSKTYLSRKYCLEILLDLLLTSRHLTSSKKDEQSVSIPNKQPTELPLTSSVLDTLLCILVDSPSALRTFESANGVQSVVKILKRANTLRVVRMKCLEFLYFYLLDETDVIGLLSEQRRPSQLPTVSNTRSYPGTPSLRIPLAKPTLNSTPRRPHVRQGSKSSGMSSSSSSSSSSRSNSSGSTQSMTSVSSVSTPASSKASPMEKAIKSSQPSFKASFQTPSSYKFPAYQPEQKMTIFEREVDYEPLSPTKSQFSTPISRPRSRTHSQLYTPSRRSTQSTELSINFQESGSLDGVLHERRKTSAEKKQFLGTMLGNIDALVEGVEKAGIWGLG